MKKITVLSLVAFFLFQGMVLAQEDENQTKPPKQGWKLGGVLPAVAYDSDIGFRYGALANFYDYGDGSVYPDFLKSLYVEWSKTTKGSATNNVSFENKKLFGRNIRMILDVNYLTEQSLDFYGFNGYQSDFNSALSDGESAQYLTRMFYRMDRKQLRTTLDVQGELIGQKLQWYAGYGFYGIKIGSVDIAKLNEGKDEADLLPDVPTLYDTYVTNGLISDEEKNGGNVSIIKAGLVYDTRDNEFNPFKGMWSELVLIASPEFMSAGNYTMLSATHRQYFTVVPDRMNVALRFGFQQKLSGDIPFYMLPFYITTKKTQDGFGGSKTLRGVLRNRVVGDAVAFTNAEVRYKVLRTHFLKQDFYIALSGFMDAGRVTQRYDYQQLPGSPDYWVDDENWHLGVGGGLHFALNESFIVAVDYGKALSEQDGSSGLYIGLNFLY